jgi:glycosyltransferase involved in cell wall biosynthesis
MRVAAVLTHPIQYYAAWFRWIAAHSRAIDLHVIYASSPTPRQQGVGFDRALSWDVPLTEGYRSTIVRPARPTDRFDSQHFRGLDVPEIDRALAEARPDVVVVFGWYSVTLARAVKTARRLKIPVLYHGDSNLQSAPGGWRRPLWVARTRWRLRQYDGCLSVGTRSAAWLRYFGVPDDRIFAAPHAVDNLRFAEAAAWRRSPERRRELRGALGVPADAFVVLFAGKLEPKKRPLDLVRAAHAMTDRPHLLVAGSGPLEEEMRAAAGQLGVGLTLRGFVNQSQMPGMYAAADCLALPSDARETWGLVVNEALASGLPCVMSDQVGCAPDLGGEATGGVCATSEPTTRILLFTEALSSVRDRLKEGHDFTPACQARAAAHSFSRATAGFERACEAAASKTQASQASTGGGTKPIRVVACCGGMVLVGGLERMTFEVLRVLRERGAVIHCVVNGWDNSRIIALAEAVGASWSTGFYWYRFTRHARRLREWAQVAWDALRTSGGLLRDAYWFGASHIFVSDYITALRNAPALALLRLSGRRVVIRLGNAPDQGRFFRWLWRLGVNPVADVFVCNSLFTERELAAHGIPAGKRVTIPHTPPTRRSNGAGPSHDDAGRRDCRRIVYAGQILPEKGVDLLLEAIALVARRGHDVRADIIGRMDGWVPADHARYRDALLARADAPDLRGRIRFLGYREDVPRLMAGAGIHCIPSRQEQREAFGIVVIEAKQAGIPSVVTRSGALPDLITHGENGWICRDETPEAVAEGIEYFLDAARLEAGMQSARASAALFGRDRFERDWHAVFAGARPHA